MLANMIVKGQSENSFRLEGMKSFINSNFQL